MKFYTNDAGVTFFRVSVKTETARWTKYWLPECATFESLKRCQVSARTVRGGPHFLADFFWEDTAVSPLHLLAWLLALLVACCVPLCLYGLPWVVRLLYSSGPCLLFRCRIACVLVYDGAPFHQLSPLSDLPALSMACLSGRLCGMCACAVAWLFCG